MKYLFALIVLIALAGCADSEQLVLVQHDPVVVEGGTLTYRFSQCFGDSCSHRFEFNASGMRSFLTVKESPNETTVTLDDVNLLSGVGSGYPSFNLSVLGQEPPVAYEEVTLQYIRGEKGALDRWPLESWGREFRRLGFGPIETDGFDHGIVLDRGPLIAQALRAQQEIELSTISSGLRGNAFFETDQLRIVSEGETVLEPNGSIVLPLYRDAIRVRLEPVESWIDEEKERYFEERRASRIEESMGPFVLPSRVWVDVGVVELRFRGSETPPYSIEYRYADHGTGTFSVGDTTKLTFSNGVYPLINISEAERVSEVDVSIEVGYFANAELERGDVIATLPGTGFCPQIANEGIIIDGVQRFGCDDVETYDLSVYGVPATATFTDGALSLSGGVRETLADGESITVEVSVPAISVQLVPMVGSWDR